MTRPPDALNVADRWPHANPFSTRRVRPGQLPFLFPENLDISQVVERFRTENFRGQIVGPHGCGKSTLACEISERISAEFGSVRHLIIRPNGGRVSCSATKVQLEIQNEPGTELPELLVIDGSECLTWINRQVLFKSTANRGIKLLITSHIPISGLPIVCTLTPDFPRFSKLVHQLLIGTGMERHFDERLLREVYQKANANIREAFMTLYDVAEQQKQQSVV